MATEMMAPPQSRLTTSARRSYQKALDALEASTVSELVALANELWVEEANRGPTRRGLQSPPARLAAWLVGGQAIRHLGIHQYLTTGELAPLVGALRQATRLEHAVGTARWIADQAHVYFSPVSGKGVLATRGEKSAPGDTYKTSIKYFEMNLSAKERALLRASQR